MPGRRGFTLVELLVVIGIIAILIGVLLPSLAKAQRQAKMTACLSNQKQLIIALLMYTQENKGFFPGGPGMIEGDSRQYKGLASWDSVAMNPYSCNQDPRSGPTFLAKYVSNSKKIPTCPAATVEVKDTGNTRADNRSNYWYPMSLVYTPTEICNNVNFNEHPLAPKQTPQKITAVKKPNNKAVIIEYQTYHDKLVEQVDLVGLQPSGVPFKRVVIAGFVDGSVAVRNTSEMFDRDVNRTGRNTRPDTAGVKGRDFP